jgi:hypothetical protein
MAMRLTIQTVSKDGLRRRERERITSMQRREKKGLSGETKKALNFDSETLYVIGRSLNLTQ